MRNLLLDLRLAASLLIAVVRWWTGPALGRLAGRRLSRRELGVRLRRFLDSQGLTYRKLAQYLAMRVDLLPHEVCQELERLFDRADPMPLAAAQRVLEEELGGPPERHFAEFDPEPVGAASVAQVHRAVAHDGEVLAVKVQRLGVERRFLSEARNFRRLAWVADRFRPFGRLSTLEIFDEFARFTAREMDFELEGRTADRLRREAVGPGLFPRVRWDLTTRRVLSMEFIDGVSLLTLCRLGDAGRHDEIARLLPGVDLDRVVAELSEACFHQFFTTGHFHGDPHPANVLVRSDGSFAFIDCGIFGEMTEEVRHDLSRYIEAMAGARFWESAHYYLRLSEPTPWTDPGAWQRELVSILAGWHATLQDRRATLEERHMGSWQGRVVRTLRRHEVRARSDLLLVWRAMVLMDTTALRLPVRFDLMHLMKDFFARRRPRPERRLQAELSPPRLAARALAASEPPAAGARLLRGLDRRRRPLAVRRQGHPSTWRRGRRAALGTGLPLAGASLALAASLAGVGGAVAILGALLLGVGAVWGVKG